jgi:hypothetical protein
MPAESNGEPPEPLTLLAIRMGLAAMGTVKTTQGGDGYWSAGVGLTRAGVYATEEAAIAALWELTSGELVARVDRLRAESEKRGPNR